MTPRTVVSKSPAETRALAASLAVSLGPGAVLALHGELGTGKTCFVQGLARALGIREPVASPTYALVHEYRGARPLVHLDLYRVAAPAGLESLGLDEVLDGGGITVIEWAERARDWLPPHTLHVTFERGTGPRERRITVGAAPPAGESAS